MGTFTTNLKLGQTAYGVHGGLDPYIEELIVGQLRITETHPKSISLINKKCYLEECMCFETGVGGGTVWEYGRNIFATRKDSERGVIKLQQEAYAQRRKRDEYLAKKAERQRQQDLQRLQELKAKYETEPTHEPT